MKSRILALLALAAITTGCTRISFLTADAPGSGQAQETVTEEPSSSTPAPASPADASSVTIGITESPGSELSTVLLDTAPDSGQKPDAEVAGMPASENTPSAVTGTESGPEIEAVQKPEEETLLVQRDAEKQQVRALCNEIGNKLGSVSVEDCLAQPLTFAGAYTVQSRPMVVRDFKPKSSQDKQARVLILGGIHGDEYSSISIMFKWMELLEARENRDFLWRFAPTVNPDGLLDGQAVRQNANGVDLNRNFPSADWQDLAEDYWTNTTNRNPRRYPGTHPASEPEVQWVVDQIKSFKPDVIVSVHAPYHLLDYDGPQDPPQKIGELHLHLLGVYPGSLGNYAGINLGIPVVTMELPSAGIMPTDEQIVSMWNDLLKWLYEHHET